MLTVGIVVEFVRTRAVGSYLACNEASGTSESFSATSL